MSKEDFIKKLKQSQRAPFLFVGSGFSRHYLNTPDWKSLLSELAPKHINQYVSKIGSEDMPAIATAIAKDINEAFWNLPEDNPYKIKHQDQISGSSSAMKIKISELLYNYSKVNYHEQYKEELEMLSKINIDGVITTNWDNCIEGVFPNFKTYIGQKELISSSVFNIAEIYKIHGCITKPDSLVLTSEDYEDFNARNKYLAAKLITIFIEHPVVFIGYSITDSNIREILKSLVICLDKDNIEKLQNNMIFVEWNPEDNTEFLIEKHDISLDQGAIIPCTRIKTHDFVPLYECLSYYERSIPAYLLREYKKQFYNIVVSQNPDKNLYVLPDTEIDNNPDIQVVYGFGAVKKFQTSVGYIGLKAIHILRDVLEESNNYEASQILEKTIPELRKSSKNAYIPIYKYLREVGINSDNDYKNNQLGINIPLKKLEDFQTYKPSKNQDTQLSLSEVINLYKGKNSWKAIVLIPYLNISESDLDLLRNFIISHINEYLINKNPKSTFMRSLICYYDWKKNGW